MIFYCLDGNKTGERFIENKGIALLGDIPFALPGISDVLLLLELMW
jgi:hypothetical protein